MLAMNRSRWPEVVIVLLLLATMACAALAIHAGSRRTDSLGPRLLEPAPDGSVWLTVDQELLIVSAQGEIQRRVDLRSLGLPGPLNALTPLPPGADGGMRMLAGVIGLSEWLVLDGHGRVVSRVKPESIGLAYRETFHLAAAGDGRIAMATSGDHRVLLFDEYGKRIAESPVGLFRFANGLWYEDGRWWVVDTNHGKLRALNGDTLAEETFIPVPETAGARFPALVRRGPAGVVTVSVLRNGMDKGVVVDLTAQGDLLRHYPSRAEDSEPVAFAWLGDTLLLADRSNYSLQRFDTAGRYLGTWGGDEVVGVLALSRAERQRWAGILLSAQVAAGAFGLLAIVAYAFWKMRPAPVERRTAVLARLATPSLHGKAVLLDGIRLYWPLLVAVIVLQLLIEPFHSIATALLAILKPLIAPPVAVMLPAVLFLVPGIALFYWLGHRIGLRARLPEFEALLSVRAVRWLQQSTMAQDALGPGEVVREVLMVQTSRLFPAFNLNAWMLTDRRLLIFRPGPGNDAKLLVALVRRDCSARIRPVVGWMARLGGRDRIEVTARDGRAYSGFPASPVTARRMADLLGDAKRLSTAWARISTVPQMCSPEPVVAFALSLLVPGLAQLLQERFQLGVVLLTIGVLMAALFVGPVLLGWLGHFYDVPPRLGYGMLGVAVFWALLAASDATIYARKAHR